MRRRKGKTQKNIRAAMNTREARQVIIAKYARLYPNGYPIECTPSQAELSAGQNRAGWGTDGKIIYDTEAKAHAAAGELSMISGDRLRVYVCPRSKRGHCHLARVWKPARD